jgi:hypothetical protein
VRGYTEIVRLLVDKGADVNHGPDGPPLHDAAAGGKAEVIMLVEHGAK